jgi:uncharacterized protein involved in outer membrane biogenesis
LIVPWFIDWDDYKANFEREATRIMGHPVRVIGTADASILPSPSLTFTNVQVGEPGAEPLMTVDRFEVTIELTPLLQGEIRVVTMRLEKPVVRVAADAAGVIDWLQRAPASQTFDPDKVVPNDVQISDGRLSYRDDRTGIAHEFADVSAAVEARSLAGPWRVSGKYVDGGKAVHFDFATGRTLDDGTIRLKSDFAPPQWPVSVTADGVLKNDLQSGLSYSGNYMIVEAVEPSKAAEGEETEPAPATGWRSEGTFNLTRDRIVVDRAVLSNGPAERPSSLAGTLTVNFGKQPSFEGSVEARQIDLDRTLAEGPTKPVDVSAAAGGFVNWLASLPVPEIPGRLAFNVPTVVVGGAVVQDLRFSVAPAAAGWEIDGFRARLPGQASVSADGVLTIDREMGFVGSGRLIVAQPAAFAAWWRGKSQPASGHLLPAFDIFGEAEIAPGRVAVDKITARIGDATISGRFAWSESRDRRHLGTELKADRINYADVKALADLLAGRNLTEATALADSFSVRAAVQSFRYEDLVLHDVAVDAAYANDVLNVVQVAVGDVGGASFRITSGRIDGLTKNPQGHLTAKLEATAPEGLALVAEKFIPESWLAVWLAHASPNLFPAVVNAKISAPPATGEGRFAITLDGKAGDSAFNATVATAAEKVAAWRDSPASLTVTLDAPDSAMVARQFGVDAAALEDDSGVRIVFSAGGLPKEVLKTDATVEFAGLALKASGALTLPVEATPKVDGTFEASTENVGALAAVAALSIPAAAGAPLEVRGAFTASAAGAKLDWQNAAVADRRVTGALDISGAADGTIRLDGKLAIDSLDFGWLTELGLGEAILPTGDAKTPWSKEPFGPPAVTSVSGRLALEAERVALGSALNLANARGIVTLQPQRMDVDLAEAHLAGGAAKGGISIQNVDGNARISGQFTLAGAELQALAWHREGRSVATGTLDISANFEGTGTSPAGAVSSATGGGVFTVRNGVVRYINPETVRSIVRRSDLGEEYSDDALKTAVERQIDADSFTMGETGGAFSVAAGTVRFNGLMARGSGIEAGGNAAIDLNAMALDSDWTLAFDPGVAAGEGGDPKIGLVFRGPLASPDRIIDALPLGSYLNTRQAARMMEIIAAEEADQAEKDRLRRLQKRMRDDADRLARAQREAAEAEKERREATMTGLVTAERLTAERERAADERFAESLGAAAAVAAANANATRAAAAAADDAAAKARSAAKAAAEALSSARTAEQEARRAATDAANALVAADAIATNDRESFVKLLGEADALNQSAVEAISAEAAAKAAGTSSDLDGKTAARVVAVAASSRARDKADTAKTLSATSEKALRDAQGADAAAKDLLAAAVAKRMAAEGAASTANAAVIQAETMALSAAKEAAAAEEIARSLFKRTTGLAGTAAKTNDVPLPRQRQKTARGTTP